MILNSYDKTFKSFNDEVCTNNIPLKNRFTALSDISSTVVNESSTTKAHYDGDSVKNKSSKRKITIIGDSIIKNVLAHKMQVGINSSDKVYVKSYSGSTIADMFHHVIPSKRYKPQMFIIHAGANDIRSTKTSENIASELIELGLDLKTDVNQVIISGLTNRNDRWNDKGMQVNHILISKCVDAEIGFIDNSNITYQHLNGSGLHLNFQGTALLARNFIQTINV